MKFDSLPLSPSLLKNLQAAGYREATPIQQKAIQPVLDGRDLIGCAQTGTGKTAAFALPTLQRLMESGDEAQGESRAWPQSGRRPIRALILAPTRELAGQIGESLATYGKNTKLRHAVIFGGVGQHPQVQALRSGVDILVATPGRLLDLMGQGYVHLGSVKILILDEADRMLDMGFIHDLRRIVAQVPKRRQTLMYSATMPPEIRELAEDWLRDPIEVHVAPVASTPERIVQSVCFVEKRQKSAALAAFLREMQSAKTLVFSRTKRGADRITSFLEREGIDAVAIHGNKSQSHRQAVMREFQSKRPPVLVATDLAARGLDFSDIAHVVNYDLPDVPETYVHRIGRTARAGAEGQALSFCGSDERRLLRMIEKLTGQTLLVRKLPAFKSAPESQVVTLRPTPGVDQLDQPQRAKAKTGAAAVIPKPAGAARVGAKPSAPKRVAARQGEQNQGESKSRRRRNQRPGRNERQSTR